MESDDDQQMRVPFLAPVVANIMAPVTESITRAALSGVMPLPAAEIRKVRCRRCEDVIALWARLTRCLYHVTRDGGLGDPLSRIPAKDVPVHCDRCRKTYRTSGRAVGRNLYNGRPLLA